MNKVPFYILCAILLYGHSAFAQEVAPSIVSYIYDAAGNRVMAISSPGYLEAEPISSTSALSRGRTVDSIVVKPQKERISPQERVPRRENYAADDRTSSQRSKKKNQQDS